MTDYRKYHKLEEYLIDEVGSKFRKTGKITKQDFYLIIIWKSNRSKSMTYNRLENISSKNNVSKISRSVYLAKSDKERMRILIEDWQFSLPIASAILAILYPHRFTIYDIRVRKEIKMKSITTKVFDNLWKQYTNYVKKVKNNAPKSFTLRDKDRHLWGKSLIGDLKKDLKSGFQKKA